MPNTTFLCFLAFHIVSCVGSPHSPCLNRVEAQQVADGWSNLISNYTNATADEVLAPEFVEWSTSTNLLIDSCNATAGPVPLNATTFTSREEFKAGQAAQPSVPYEFLDLWFSCNHIIIRSQSIISTDGSPVVGMLTLETELAPENNTLAHWIKVAYSEFDVVKWCKARNFAPSHGCNSWRTVGQTTRHEHHAEDAHCGP